MAKIRVKKREAVIPFHGEENFVVPKRGGFAQHDNENYVMVAGSSTVTTSNLPTDGTTNTTSGTNIPVTTAGEPIISSTTTTSATQPVITTPPVATAQQLCVSNGGLWVNGACQTSPAPEPLPAETNCINSGGAWINGACVTSTSPKPISVATTTVVDTLPNFPVWSSLDCTTLKDKIAEYNAILSTSRFAQNIVDAYNTEIAKAQAIYNTKCNVTPPTPAPTPNPIVLPPIGGGIFGGGGGGFGEPPSDAVVPPVEEKNNMGIYLILGGLALLYFLTRKKKK